MVWCLLLLLLRDAAGFAPNTAAAKSFRSRRLDAAAMELSVAERARTTTELGSASGAALSTQSVSLEGNPPWTSYVDYVVDENGCAVFLLRDSAEHADNLKADQRCSLMAQAAGKADNAAKPRVTMSGTIETVDDKDELAQLTLAFGLAHPYAEDLLTRSDFSLARVVPSSVFYVGGFGVQAQWVDLRDYADASPDVVAAGAAALTKDLNSERHADDLRVAARHLLDCPDADSVSVAAVDSLGLDFRVTTGQRVQEFRVAYRNKPHSAEDARSELNKLLQEAWEHDQGLDYDGSYDTKPRVKQYAQAS